LASAGAFFAPVLKVSDGGAITVFRYDKGDRNSIDCPEKGQDFGARTKQLTSDLCYGF